MKYAIEYFHKTRRIYLVDTERRHALLDVTDRTTPELEQFVADANKGVADASPAPAASGELPEPLTYEDGLRAGVALAKRHAFAFKTDITGCDCGDPEVDFGIVDSEFRKLVAKNSAGAKP